MLYYAGIGSQETPVELAPLIATIAKGFVDRGFTLNSGAACGADSMFEAGQLAAGGECNIFLPWPFFNKHDSNLVTQWAQARDIAATIHPAWSKLSQGQKKLHARNIHQVLGRDLNTPVKCVVCWTLGGQDIGGTRTAIKLARSRDIPVFNLWHEQTIQQLREFLRGYKCNKIQS